MTIKTMNRAAARLIGDKAPAHLQTFCEDNGLTVEYKGGQYDPDAGTFTARLVFAIEGADPARVERAADRIRRQEVSPFEEVDRVPGLPGEAPVMDDVSISVDEVCCLPVQRCKQHVRFVLGTVGGSEYGRVRGSGSPRTRVW